MRLEITRRADLATRGLLALAAEGRRLKAGVLAERIGTTPGFLSQAMTPLVARGWVRSEPGPNGGYLLVTEPAAIDVLAIIETIEGPTDQGRCVLEDRPCASAGTCALHRPWLRARRQLLDELAGTSLAELQDRPAPPADRRAGAGPA
jgi:Rrf2 family transcriptional regulator, iron-sulfur cluster assembly transcription factor